MKRSASAFLAAFFLLSPGASAWEFAGWEGGGCYPNVEFDPNVRDRVYLASDVAGIWRSDDLGERWRFVTKGLNNLHVAVLAVARVDSNVLYAGTADGVFVSKDAGENWQAANTSGGRIRFHRPESHRSIAISAADPASLVVGTADGQVFYSQDSGRSWKLLGDRRPFAQKKPVTALTWVEEAKLLFASSEDGLAEFSFEKSSWRLFSGPVGVTDFWVGEGARKIVASGREKLFVSEDGGASWQVRSAVPKGALFRLLVLDASGETLLAAQNDSWSAGVLRSEDGGASWKKWDERFSADLLSDPTRVWAASNGRINALKRDPFRANVLFRTDWWGVWRSDDGGVSWTEKIKGSPNTVTSDVALSDEGEIYVATMDNGLLKSSDGGRTYRCLFPSTGYSKEMHGHVWRVLVSGRQVLATSSPWESDWNQIIRSDDAGETFQRVRNGLPARKPRVKTVWDVGYARAVARDPSRPDTVYLGVDGKDGGGLFISKDGGRSWDRSKGQPGSLTIYNALAVDPDAPSRLLWGSGERAGSIYLSEDGGENWSRRSHPAFQIFDAAFGRGGRAYASGESSRHEPLLYGSTDGGKNWTLLKKFEGSGAAEALCVLPDGRLAVGVMRWHSRAPGSVHLLSADGNVWKDITGDLPPGEGPSAMAYDEKEKTLYMARGAGSVYKTRDL